MELKHSILVNKISGLSNTFCGELYIPKTMLSSVNIFDQLNEIADRDLINTAFEYPTY